MVTISNDFLISMHCGDYLNFPLFINAGTKINPLRYILQPGDKLLFAISDGKQPFECSAVRKIFTSENLNPHGDVDLILESSDTINLLPGTYYYEAKLITYKNNTEYIDTIIPKRRFILL